MTKTNSKLINYYQNSGVKNLLKPIINLIPKKNKIWIWNKLTKYNPNALIDIGELKPVLIKIVDFLKDDGDSEIGDYLEFGVYDGTSMSVMYKVFKQAKVKIPRLFGFDSFEGLPPEAAHDDESWWHPGEFNCDYDSTVKSLRKKGVDLDKVHLIKGFYSETLNQKLISKYRIKKAGIIMIDCDMYLSACDALNFCIPLIKEKTIIIFDDWLPAFEEKNLGEKKACEEFLANNKNLKATLFAEYSYRKRIHGKVFLIENTNFN